MAEYYPLLAKAVGSIPNSTADSRRVVYERARKALIGQLRTLHPPIPDDDIERESVALDRAIERLESELASGGIPAATPAPLVENPPTTTEVSTNREARKTNDAPKTPDTPSAEAGAGKPQSAAPSDRAPLTNGGALGPTDKPPIPPLRTKAPKTPAPKTPAPKTPVPKPTSGADASDLKPIPFSAVPVALQSSGTPAVEPVPGGMPVVAETPAPVADEGKRLKPVRSDPQRPIAPQAPIAAGPKRRLWIVPVAIALVVAVVAYAAWKLRDHPETIARGKPAAQSQADSGKIAERVGAPGAPTTAPATSGQDQSAAQTSGSPAPATSTTPPSGNPELPVAHRAALLVEAPDEPNKVKTFLGTVVWKLNNIPQGPNDAVGLAVEADIDLPDDKMKAIVTFAKNTEASLPASHTINVHYSVEPGSFTGDVKQISVPQMRPESSPSGEPLAGVTVQIVPNSFLVGLSPGNAETANTDLIRRLQWVDIPMLLDSGKIAKLTFEKGDSGQRDLSDALDAWAKQ